MCEKDDGLRKYSRVGSGPVFFFKKFWWTLNVYLAQHSLHDLSLLAFIFYHLFFFFFFFFFELIVEL